MSKTQVKKDKAAEFRLEDVIYRKGKVINEQLAWTSGKVPTFKIESVRKTPKCSWAIITRLLEALEHAKLKNCSVDKKAQEAMKLYLDTWVVGHISAAIQAMTIKTEYKEK